MEAPLLACRPYEQVEPCPRIFQRPKVFAPVLIGEIDGQFMITVESEKNRGGPLLTACSQASCRDLWLALRSSHGARKRVAWPAL